MAITALIQWVLAGANQIILSMGASRATKAIGPTSQEKRGGAFFFGVILIKEMLETRRIMQPNHHQIERMFLFLFYKILLKRSSYLNKNPAVLRLMLGAFTGKVTERGG
ncbi:hypothetical protein [Cohnella cholangitidis]|uniref:hypothetical protein n=1 Tax=Cohnella cholangitidis TaxID=2598458 RepID=UPI001E283552|nr:hypothetical protein [Cohnella cholangitidis]